MPKRKFQSHREPRPKVKRTKWNKRRRPLARQAGASTVSSGDDETASDAESLNEDLDEVVDESTVPAVRLLAATFNDSPSEERCEEPSSADHKTKPGSTTVLSDQKDSEPVASLVPAGKTDPESDELVGDGGEGEDDEHTGLDSAEDPFVIHFERTLTEEEADSARKKEDVSEKDVSIPNLGSFTLKSNSKHGTLDILENIQRPLAKSHVKLSLVKNVAASRDQPWTETATAAFSLMNTYRDFFHFEKDHRLDFDTKRAYCLHTLNHLLKARSRVVAHNSKIVRGTNEEVEHRDQGFTRPKVVIIVPFKQHAFLIYQILTSLLTTKNTKNEKNDTKKNEKNRKNAKNEHVKNTKDEIQVMNKTRFEEEFGWEEKDPVLNSDRGEDFRGTFLGNTDDCFRIGVSVTKKTLKMYAEFYSADVIIASPLGLRMIIGTEGEKQHEYDFLSSVEILILDQADIFLMQNWEHILWIMKHMHRQPKTITKVDFSRVRHWVLNGWGQLYRQTIFLSAFRCPEFQALVNRSCSNFAGALWQKPSPTENALSSVVVPIPHCFHRIPGNDYQKISDARFKHFTEKILPQLNDSSKTQTMIFIPSYFDFVRIRNHFKREDVSFVQICEYTSTSKIARARDLFYHGKKHFLLYTERFHFYRRYRIKGIRHILFYDLPHYSHFYPELCNMMMGGEETAFHQFTSDVLYSKFDSFKLSSVVGVAKVPAMLQLDKSVHMFVTSPAETA